MELNLILIIFGYFLFAIIGLAREIYFIKINKKIAIVSMCRIIYVLLLAVIPGIIFCGRFGETLYSSVIDYDDRYIWTFWAGLIYTVIGYIAFELGYALKQKEIKPKEENQKQKIIIFSSVITLISFISLLLWSSGYGGITGIINNANFIRAGFIKSSRNFAFFKHFVPLSMISSLLLFNALFVSKTVKGVLKQIYSFVVFCCSLIIALIYIIANDGRMLAGVFILLFVLISLKNSYEVKDVKISKLIIRSIILIAVVFVLILNSESFFALFRKTAEEEKSKSLGFMGTVTKEFSFIVSGLQSAFKTRINGSGGFMFKNDLINGIFAWLPTSLKPITLADVWDYNTMLLASGSHGQSPTSIAAQSVYDLGMLGILFIPFIYGCIIKKTENLLEAHKNSTFYNTVYLVLGFYLAKGIAYFSMYNIMMNIFFIVIAMLVYTIFKKFSLKGSQFN